MAARAREGERTVATNRRARYDYEILERVEAGIVLTGSEVKSLRAGRVSLSDAYARIRDDEVWLEEMHVAPYAQGQTRGYEPKRPRKLLLHRGEIARLVGKTQERGLTLVPLRVYFRHGLAKVELGLARGKRKHEKRRAIIEREQRREIERATSLRR
ncbi:MAG TPA: SsrA-binding protein SmpB [Actinomycetota bacterium]|nr:SsrA-binding protein SmpB [Actinomycetota bacterium]